MKRFCFHWAVRVVVTTILCPAAQAAPFANLDFEASSYPADAPFSDSEPASALFPSWTVWIDDTMQSSASLNGTVLTGPAATLYKVTPPSPLVLQGSASLYLQASVSNSVSIAQSGDVPSNAQSLRFLARDINTDAPPGPFELLFDGQNVPVVTLSVTGDDYVMGADITTFAGGTSELRLRIPSWQSSGILGSALIDAIEFSPDPIPEPAGIAALLAVASLWLRQRDHLVK